MCEVALSEIGAKLPIDECLLMNVELTR